MGTRFVATVESEAPDAYKRMLVTSQTSDVLETDAIAGLTANWLRPSIVANGLDPNGLPRPKGLHRPDLPEGVRAWHTVWSAGHSVGLIEDLPTVAELAVRFERELEGQLAPDWRARVQQKLER
jgi:nitronate monooxygenase